MYSVLAPGFVLILIWFFFEIPWLVKYLTVEWPTKKTLFFVGTELGFGLFVVVICSDLYVGLVSFLFILCIPFDILLSVEVETWMTTDEGSQIDLNKVLLVSKNKSVIYLFIYFFQAWNVELNFLFEEIQLQFRERW